MPTDRRPTYRQLLDELRKSLHKLEEAAAHLPLPGPLRYRLLVRANRVRAVLKAAQEE